MRVKYLDIKRTHEPIMPDILEALERVVSSGWVVLGKELEEFEKEFAKYIGVKYSVGVANGLDALILSLRALGVGPGDEVVVPSNTYIATLIASSMVGATPVLVEPSIETYNINPKNIEQAITKRTKAVIPVHLFGQACEMEEIMSIMSKYKLMLVEDNAQAHGSTYKGKRTGSFGIVNATSFYPGKNLGALGDGGAVTTDNKNLTEKVRMLRNYGSKIKYFNDVIGVNSRLDELQASFLKLKLKRLDSGNKKRNEIADRYIEELAGVGDLIIPKTAKNCTHVYHVFALRTKKRNKLESYLKENGVGTVIHYPLSPHLQKAYRHLGFKKGDFPISEELAETSISIPIYPELTNGEQSYVINCIKSFYG